MTAEIISQKFISQFAIIGEITQHGRGHEHYALIGQNFGGKLGMSVAVSACLNFVSRRTAHGAENF